MLHSPQFTSSHVHQKSYSTCIAPSPENVCARNISIFDRANHVHVNTRLRDNVADARDAYICFFKQNLYTAVSGITLYSCI